MMSRITVDQVVQAMEAANEGTYESLKYCFEVNFETTIDYILKSYVKRPYEIDMQHEAKDSDLKVKQMTGRNERMGRVGMMDEAGLCTLKDEETHARYIFTLDKIEGYRGEPLKDFRVKKGSIVKFIIQNDHVAAVEPVE